MSKCICKIPQTRTIPCFNRKCSNTNTVQKSGAEVMSMCPEHRHGIAFCGYGSSGYYLCDGCKSQGYSLKQGSGGGMFGPNYELVKDDG